MDEQLVAYYQSPVGLIKLAGTNQYINEVSFIENDNNGVDNSNMNDLLHQCIQELNEYFNGQRISFNIPVQQNGTAFQTRVWGELLQIGFGRTISYMTLAKRLGNAKCIRAAANSNGKNRICILVPCHRVIGSNQTLVGYTGGLWRKKWLLEHENRLANGFQNLF